MKVKTWIVMAGVVLTILGVILFLCFSQENEQRDDNYILTGPQVKATRIIKRIKTSPERFTVLCSNTRISNFKGQDRITRNNMNGKKAIYSYSTQQDGGYLRLCEESLSKKSTTIIDYDFKELLLPRALAEEGEIGAVVIYVQREQQTIEQDIYDDYSKGVGSSFHTIQYTVYPVTSMKLEYIIEPCSEDFTSKPDAQTSSAAQPQSARLPLSAPTPGPLNMQLAP